MALVQRYDRGALRPARRTDNGRLIVDATLTRTGVLVYRNPDGSTRREYRPASEVFKADSMASLALVPVTDDHPPTMIDAGNAAQYTVGSVGESVRRDGIHLVGTLAINVGATVAKMDAGKREVSCGYACNLDMSPGVSPEGEPYDGVQTDIVYNHVAIVDAGRAGSARVNMDAAVEVDGGADDTGTSARGAQKEATTVNLEQALAALAAANEKIGGLTARADAADARVREAEQALARAEQAAQTATARADAAEKKAAEAESARKDAADRFDARVIERAELVANARTYLAKNERGESLRADGSAANFTALTDREIQVEVVQKLDGVSIPASRSDEAAAYAYDLAIARAAKGAEALGAARTTIERGRADGPASDDAEANARKASKNTLHETFKGARGDARAE